MGTSITIPSQSVTIPAQNVNVPSPYIVYQNSWLGQTVNMSTTTIFTPSQPGMYRVTVVSYVGGGSTGSISGYLNAGSFAIGSNMYEAYSSYSQPASLTFSGFSGTPLTINAAMGGYVTSYDLYVTVEQLQ